MMSLKPGDEQIQLWLSKSERNIEMAIGALSLEHYESCAFWCQQSVELTLKAYWMHVKNEFAPKTHRIIDLAEKLEIPDELIVGMDVLESDYMAVRYPIYATFDVANEYDEESALSL